jgi:NADPH2:quinone reductase
MELTNNKGVNAVFDGVGKSTFDISLACLTTLGTMISFGNASGKVDDIDIMKLVPNCIKLTRPSLFQLVKTKQDFEPCKCANDIFELTFVDASELVNLLCQKKIHFHIHKIYPLSECGQAHIDLETQKSSGKLVLDCIAK